VTGDAFLLRFDHVLSTTQGSIFEIRLSGRCVSGDGILAGLPFPATVLVNKWEE
jgi:hypothetical protein